MIKFNWEKVKRLCNYNTVDILQYFCFIEKVWFPSYLPKTYSHKVYIDSFNPYPKGESYILNIQPVLMNKEKFFQSDIYEYISMASCRSYFDYKLRDIITLPVVIAKANSMDLRNPLITVINDNIHFKYETEKTGVNK